MKLERDECKHKYILDPDWTGLSFKKEHARKSCKSKMAAKPKVHKSKDGSKAKENKRWIFDDDMTASLVECLKIIKRIKKAKESILKAI